MDKVKQFVQIISYVRCAKGFGNQPQVIDGPAGCSGIYMEKRESRQDSAIGANELPGAAPPKYWLWWKQRRTDTGQEPAKEQ